jgi:hypothetical protein
MLVAVNGTYVTVVIDGTSAFSYTYAPRVDADGYVHYLNEGMVGLGTDNAKGRIDNVFVQVLPQNITFDRTEDFSTGSGELLAGTGTGNWVASGGYLVATPAPMSPAEPAIMLSTAAPVGAAYSVTMETKLATTGSGGFVFDRYTSTDYKFVNIDKVTGKVIIGHRTKRGGVVIDATAALPASATGDYTLRAVLTGNVVTVSVNGQQVLSFAYFALVTDGRFGLMSAGGTTTFDSYSVKTTDPSTAIVPEGLGGAPPGR